MFRKFKYLFLILSFAQLVFSMEESACDMKQNEEKRLEPTEFSDLPPEMMFKIFNFAKRNLSEDDLEIKEILKSLIQLAGISNCFRTFVKNCFKELMDTKKEFTIQRLLAFKELPNVFLEVLKNITTEQQINIITASIRGRNYYGDGYTMLVNMLKMNWISKEQISNFCDLIEAIQFDCVIISQILIESKKGIYFEDKFGLTPLVYAIFFKNEEITKMLINAGVDVNISIAAMKKPSCLFSKGETSTTLLEYAIKRLLNKIALLLIDAKAEIDKSLRLGYTVLMDAATNNLIDVVEKLIEVGANIQTTNKYGWNALMLAALKGHSSIVKMLIDAGSNLNVQNIYGGTALMYAAKNGFVDVVKLLIEAGADLTLRNKDGKNAANMASENGHFEITQLIVNGRTEIEK